MDVLSRMLIKLLWIATAVGASIGAYLLYLAMASESAPAQGAAAAVAVGFTVIPYVFARAAEGLDRRPPND